MSPSIPFNFPFMSLSFLGMSASLSMYVPFFHCQSFPYISLRVLWFPCPLFAFQSPSLPLLSCFFRFMSLSVAICCLFISPCFPVMSTSCPLHVLAFSRIFSPHFPALPCSLRSLAFFRKKGVKQLRVFKSFSNRRQTPRTLLKISWSLPETISADIARRVGYLREDRGSPPPPCLPPPAQRLIRGVRGVGHVPRSNLMTLH